MTRFFEKFPCILVLFVISLLCKKSLSDNSSILKKPKLFRWSREAPLTITSPGRPTNGGQGYSHNRLANINTDEGYGAPIKMTYISPTSNPQSGYVNSQDQSSGTGISYTSPSNLQMAVPLNNNYYGAPLQVTPTNNVRNSNNNIDGYYNEIVNQRGQGSQGMSMGTGYQSNYNRGYYDSPSVPSHEGGELMQHYQPGNSNQKQGEGSMKKGSSPVNYSAVGLLGLLALMGMIQHVMTDMDMNMSTMKPASNSGGEKQRPIRSIQHNIIRIYPFKISLRNETVSRLSNNILPTFVKIANILASKKLKKTQGKCLGFYVQDVYHSLTKDFNIPKQMARFSLRKSLELMLKKIGLQNLKRSFLSVPSSLSQFSSQLTSSCP